MTITEAPSRSAPVAESPSAATTIASRVRDWARKQPDQVCMREKDLGLWQEVTWSQYWDTVQTVAHGLLALGVEPGDRVAILSANNWFFTVSYLAVLGVGAVGGGIGTLAAAKNKASGIEDAAAPGSLIPTFPQGQYTSDVDDDFNSLKTLNLVTPILIAAGGALLVGGIAMIAVDRTNKKKGKGFYAGKKRLEVTGLGAAPLPGGGAAGSFALRF